MKQFVKHLLNRLPYIRGLRKQVLKEGFFPAGHYYSPIPEKEEALAYIHSRKPLSLELPGIHLNTEYQLQLLHEYRQYYKELPFPEKQEPGFRYYHENAWYSYSDAIFLYCFLRKHRPKRIVEIGSGFSSALMLDTADRFFSQRPEMTLIEPDPERLKSLLRSGDENRVRIIDKLVQELSYEPFSSLESGDLLFIDSSHIMKCGSDVQFLFFDVLPFLPPGIFVHFHDVFYPFEYPSEWLKEGRYWNENYFLRAFLSYNTEWSIYFFNTFVLFAFSDFIQDHMPLCARNPVGSLYIRREVKSERCSVPLHQSSLP